MKKITRMLLLAICIVFFPAVQVKAEEAATFSGNGVIDGDKITVSVTVDKGGAASGQFEVSYDPKLVEIVSADMGSSLNADVVSINSEYKENTAVCVGFASATEEITAGELLTIDFKITGVLPEEGISFPVSVTEWNGVKQSQTDYEIAFKPDGTVEPGKSDPVEEENPKNEEPNTNPNVSADNNAASTAAQIKPAVNTGDNAPSAGAGFVLMAGVFMAAAAMKKGKIK